jgi:hypothetical protein
MYVIVDKRIPNQNFNIVLMLMMVAIGHRLACCRGSRDDEETADCFIYIYTCIYDW